MTDLLARLKAAPPERRRAYFAALSRAEAGRLERLLEAESVGFTPAWAPQYQDRPAEFVTELLGETLWSRQVDVLESIRDNPRTAVPACHGPGKTHLAARAVGWWQAVHPPGTALAVTTATRYRQVKTLLWPHIRRLVDRHGLPGTVHTTEWKIGPELVAWGFSAAHTDEAAVQGIHAPHVLFVVDEAGGIPHLLGRAFESAISGGHARILAIGNPATDEEGTWFEEVCQSPRWNVIRIAAKDTPAFTGEDAGLCESCPPFLPDHPLADHLVSKQWVEDVTAEFGAESAFVQARVDAKFPRSVAQQAVPFQWLEDRLAGAGTPPDQAGTLVALGVDIASDGGDELAIAELAGNTIRLVHTSRGAVNAEPHTVAGTILEKILDAEATAARLAGDLGVDRSQVEVKVDSIGVGWGICGILEAWGTEGMHHARIVRVNVAENATGTDVDASGEVKPAVELYANLRAQVWWAVRRAVEPTDGWLRLEVDRKTLAQCSGPKYGHDSRGRIKIESKDALRKRGRPSPDRADAVGLAIYRPPAPKIARIRN